eukprot:gnl/MRDRNA2_/MRDRNA2_50553_c0_seq2.p1 gnl/MRDRNA2_/MRDRNA2_50553_c0~~gnl/MRDRNA2_/MRDRNA2_50553_c0_seq2.p1  ORF type:complete len:239 (+),score=41.96 gnl/MRDRNA2_/MRDRNA2_50553_c0_seq2:58-717(+)
MDVKRHPYSFLGHNRQQRSHGLVGAWVEEGKEPTWHESLLTYFGGSETARKQAQNAWSAQARKAGISMDFEVQTQWQPIDSHRVMLYAQRQGKQEPYIAALNRRHFEERKSASHRINILDSAAEAGLDRSSVGAFLDSDELVTEVWDSYRSTVEEKGIHSIPLFIFNINGLTNGGPFRDAQQRHWTVRGAQDPSSFLAIFEELMDFYLSAARAESTKLE